MEKMNRGDKIYLDENKTEESVINKYLECRDGVVEMYKYHDCSGYGHLTRLFYCRNTKHETVSIIRHIYIDSDKRWKEEEMLFDTDSFLYLKALIMEKEEEGYVLVRDY